MNCFNCGKKDDLWEMELYNRYSSRNISCCKKSENCKLKTWKYMESVICRKTDEDINNSIEVWNNLFPHTPAPKFK